MTHLAPGDVDRDEAVAIAHCDMEQAGYHIIIPIYDALLRAMTRLEPGDVDRGEAVAIALARGVDLRVPRRQVGVLGSGARRRQGFEGLLPAPGGVEAYSVAERK